MTMENSFTGSLFRKIMRVKEAGKPIEIFKVDYKPLFKVFRHVNGAVTIAIRRCRIKIWGWWK